VYDQWEYLGGDMTIKTQVSMSTIVHEEMSEYVRVYTYGIESAPPSSYPLYNII
jgi:hypothetical protein